jgi:hypothetical protein
MRRTLGCLLLALVFAAPALTQDVPPGAPPKKAPAWVLPADRAREVAREGGKPLLIVSLNGNLDGFC